MEKGERIEAKRQELKRILAGLPENKKRIAADLIEQAAFMAVTLEDLNENINKNGTVEEYTNGANQSGRKVSSDAKLYTNLIAKYSAIISKLIKLAPDEIDARRETPEQYDHIERAKMEANDRAKEYKKHQKAEAAFLDALAAGKVTQDDFNAFVADELARMEESE